MLDFEPNVLYLIALVGIIGIGVGSLVLGELEIPGAVVNGLLGFLGGVGAGVAGVKAFEGVV
jgi:hypothetical protein